MRCLKRPTRRHRSTRGFVYSLAILLAFFTFLNIASGQSPAVDRSAAATERYENSARGVSVIDLVRHAISSNGELAAARIEIARARARLRQAGLRPNPAVDFEQQNGVLDSPGERATSFGFSLPLELWGQRGRRMDLAQVTLEAAVAEVGDRERRLAGEVRLAYAEALAIVRELEVTERLNKIDIETARLVEVRINEGDAAPIELNLLRVEIDRLRARRALLAGRLESAMLRLKQLSGMPADEPVTLREALASPLVPQPPSSLDASLEIALRNRPDLKFARLSEEAAQAGYHLVKAEASPHVTAFTRYGQTSSAFDETPVGFLRDRDRLFSFGVSIVLPVFNRNQGAKAEAQLAIIQARKRREFAESVVRAEVTSAYRRYEAALASLQIYELGVITRTVANVETIRAAYEAGAFRISELISEQRRLIESQRELTEALMERYRALADINTALGVTVND
ncbi:MAG: TolC family protein [Acidobacteriota bacterium]